MFLEGSKTASTSWYPKTASNSPFLVTSLWESIQKRCQTLPFREVFPRYPVVGRPSGEELPLRVSAPWRPAASRKNHAQLNTADVLRHLND